MRTRALVMLLTLLLISVGSNAQIATGGGFSLEKSVVSAGGGSSQASGFTLDGTAGQSSVGSGTGSPSFVKNIGFWTPGQLAPTAAGVTISGRVRTSFGRGIRRVVVTLVDFQGVRRSTQTGTFGYYRFDDVLAGQTYNLSVTAKRYEFANTSILINVLDELADLDFIAIR